MIRILTDSASDILPAEAVQLGVDVIPLNVTLEDGTVIRDGVDLTPSEYYEHMASCKKLPTTSQPSPSTITPSSRRACGPMRHSSFCRNFLFHCGPGGPQSPAGSRP